MAPCVTAPMPIRGPAVWAKGTEERAWPAATEWLTANVE